jgi:hypothetical protein
MARLTVELIARQRWWVRPSMALCWALSPLQYVLPMRANLWFFGKLSRLISSGIEVELR